MALLRTIFGVLISLGLTFAPAAAAMPARDAAQHAPMAAMDDCPHHKAATTTNDPCDHDGVMDKCDPASCALKCFKVVATLTLPAPQIVFAGLPSTHTFREEPVAMNWRPSTPPPRI